MGATRSFVGDFLPACNLSLDHVDTVIDNFNANYLRNIDNTLIVGLPNDNEWEVAARVRRYGLFNWGDSINSQTADRYAQVAELSNQEVVSPGIRTIGTTTPNAIGIYDTHGNVAELTSDNTIRGGAWHHNMIETRASARIDMPNDTSVNIPQAGVRLKLIIDE